MRGILVKNSEFDGIGQNSSEKANRARRRTRASLHDRPSAQFLRFDIGLRLAGHDVPQGLVDVGLGQILDLSIAKQGDDVPTDPTRDR